MSIDHGIVDFTNTETTYGQSVAVRIREYSILMNHPIFAC